MGVRLLLVSYCMMVFSQGPLPMYDLAIKNAALFDTGTGKVVLHKTILVSAGVIAGITDDQRHFTARKTIDAKGKLVTPGFIDVHTHLTSVLGDYEQAPLVIRADSVSVYRERHARAYLPYGITTVRMVGEPESWIPMTLNWQKHPIPNAPDVYTCGAALVSPERGRITYISHVVVKDPADAARKVQQYYDLGIRDIKLYWRLQYPAFTAALRKALALHMTVCAHIDRLVVARDSALALGLRDLEHIHPYGAELLSYSALQKVQGFADRYYSAAEGAFLGWQMEVWNEAGMNNPRMLRSIQLLKRFHASLTPTIHLFGQALGLSYMKTPILVENGGLDTRGFTKAQLERCIKGYSIMTSYVKKMYDEGVLLNLGTDCPEGGKSALSEMLLLHQLDIPMADVLKIATINSAKAIGRDNLYGSIEEGKKADLIIFDQSPLEKPVYLLGKKTIIKDGIQVAVH